MDTLVKNYVKYVTVNQTTLPFVTALIYSLNIELKATSSHERCRHPHTQ